MKLEKNVGIADRVLRFGISALMIYLAFFENSIIQDQMASMVLGAFGIIVLLSAVIGSCPLYGLVGFNSAGGDGEE